jgi:hypothetical protein
MFDSVWVAEARSTASPGNVSPALALFIVERALGATFVVEGEAASSRGTFLTFWVRGDRESAVFVGGGAEVSHVAVNEISCRFGVLRNADPFVGLHCRYNGYEAATLMELLT